MIECELCGNYFHPDYINKCPECELELCPKCYEKHIRKCISETFDFDENEYEEDSVLLCECPECEGQLTIEIDEIDGDKIKSARFCCLKCDFEEELNEEQLAELNQRDDDEYDCYEESEEDVFEDEEE